MGHARNQHTQCRRPLMAAHLVLLLAKLLQHGIELKHE